MPGNAFAHNAARAWMGKNMSRKRKFIIAGLAAIVLVGGFLAYVALTHSDDDQLTVAELKAQGKNAFGRVIQVKGEVKYGSITWDRQNLVLRFALSDAPDTLDVIYRGVAPDSFKPGADVTLEGRYSESGVFEAQSFSSSGSFLCSICH